MSLRAEIHRPNLGSLAYVWIGDHEHVCATTSEAHSKMRNRGNVVFVSRTVSGQSSVETYLIEKETPR